MTGALNALFVHGVGQQGKDFADDARQHLRRACGERDIGLYAVSALWAPLADAAEHRFLDAAEARGSRGVATQRLVVGTLADALYWQSSPSLRRRVFDLLDEQTHHFGNQPYTAFCHSLGGLIYTDWLRGRPGHRANVRLVTMGCNIGLFTLGDVNFQPVSQLERPNAWVNFFYPKDMLGYALRGEDDPWLDRHVTDREVSPPWGNFFSTGLCHVRYWGDKSLWRKSIPFALGLGAR